jgi:hypothetical protein
MVLYLDYSPLVSNAGPCVAAYSALQLTGQPITTVYGAMDALAGAARGRDLVPPVLVTDTGEIIASLPDILAWGSDAVAAQDVAPNQG